LSVPADVRIAYPVESSIVPIVQLLTDPLPIVFRLIDSRLVIRLNQLFACSLRHSPCMLIQPVSRSRWLSIVVLSSSRVAVWSRRATAFRLALRYYSLSVGVPPCSRRATGPRLGWRCATGRIIGPRPATRWVGVAPLAAAGRAPGRRRTAPVIAAPRVDDRSRLRDASADDPLSGFASRQGRLAVLIGPLRGGERGSGQGQGRRSMSSSARCAWC
ncbi:hypothetical protein EV121DRAFT_260329, partial [Schizophyllum commune]